MRTGISTTSNSTLPQESNNILSNLKLSALSFLSATLFLGIYWIARVGIDSSDCISILKVLSLAAVIHLGPSVTESFSTKLTKSLPLASCRSLLPLVVLCAGGVLFRSINYDPSFILFFFGFTTCALFCLLIAKTRKTHGMRNNHLILFFLVWTIFSIIQVYKDYMFPLALESPVPNYNPDTVYLSSLVSMFRTYGAASTGIDGLNFVAYHHGSYWIFAQLAQWLNIDGHRFFQLAYPALFLPLFLKILLLVVAELSCMRKQIPLFKWQQDPTTILRCSPFFWGFLMLAFIHIKPSTFSFNTGDIYSLYLSQSHLTSLILAFSLVSLAIYSHVHGFISRKKFFSKPHLHFFLIVGFAAVSYTKLSTGCFLLSLWIYYLYRCRYFHFSILALTVLASLSFFLICQLSAPLTPLDPPFQFRVGPHSFLISVVSGWWRLGTIVNVIFWPTIFFLLDSNRLMREMMLIVGLAFIVAGTLIIRAEFAFYFFDLPSWLAIVLCLSNLGDSPTKLIVFSHQFPKLVRSVVSIVFLSWTAQLISGSAQFAKKVLKTRNQIMTSSNIELPPQIQLLNRLHQLSQLSRNEKQNSMVYVPKTNLVFWQFYDGVSCHLPSFVIPAITGITHLHGLPPKNCTYYQHYGFSHYSSWTDQLGTSRESIDELCASVKSRGFKGLIILNQIEFQNRPALEINKWSCAEHVSVG